MAFGYFRSASRRVMACSLSVACLASLLRAASLTSATASFSTLLSASETKFWLWSGGGEVFVAMLLIWKCICDRLGEGSKVPAVYPCW